jgi:DNA-binding response OmpR family regulator
MPTQHVLLVEDNDIDAKLFEQALKIARPNATLTRLPDVLSAVYYLRGISIYADRTAHPLPYLVVIDLNLDQVNGMELLKWMTKEPAMKGILSLILSASEDGNDVLSAYAHGTSSYIKKLHDRADLAARLALLHDRWLLEDLIPPDETPSQ